MMRYIAAAVGLALAAPGAAAGWKLVFADDFNGATLDRQKWATRYIYNGETLDHLNDELQHFRDNDNHRVADGALSLIARPTGPTAFESGLIRSKQTFYYGYIEARVWLPKGRGVWPDFWINSDYDAAGNLHWPPEIDIFEYVINGVQDTENMFHTAGRDSFPQGAEAKIYSDPNVNGHNSYVAPAPLNQGWHVFGLAWQPDRFTVFLDGKRIVTRKYSWVYKDGRLAGPAHVLINFSVGGHWAGRYGVDRQFFPQATKVDYVHVCQIDRAGGGQRLCGGSPYTPDPVTYGYKTPFDDLPKPEIGKATIAASSGSLTIKTPIRFPDFPVAPRRLHLTAVSDGDKSTVGEAIVPLNANNQQIAIPAEIAVGRAKGPISLFAEIQSQDTNFTKPAPVICSGPEPAIKATRCLIGRAVY